MTTTRLKRPRDPVQLGKLIGDIETGQVEDRVEDKRNLAAVTLGSLGGKKSGKARAQKRTPEQRQEIAQKEAQKRWKKV